MFLQHIPTPHVPRIFTKSSTRDSNVSYTGDDLSTNPTKASTHPSVTLLTNTHHLSHASHFKCEESSPIQQPSLDISFGDYFYNYWRNTVADEQDESSVHFMDAHGSNALEDFLSDRALKSCIKFPGFRWERCDDWTWHPRYWHRMETGAHWRRGDVISKVPKEIRLVGGGGGSYIDEDYSLELDDWKNDNDDYVCAEGHADYGVIGEPSYTRRRNLPNEQDPSPRQLGALTSKTCMRSFYQTQPIKSHVALTGFTVDFSSTDPSPLNVASGVPDSGASTNYDTRSFSMGSNHESYSCTPPLTHIPCIPPNYPVHAHSPMPPLLSDSSVSLYATHTPFLMSYAPPVLDRNRKYAHNPSRITTPAPLGGSTQHFVGLSSRDPFFVQRRETHDAVIRAGRWHRLIGFFYMTTEQKVAEIERLIRSMRPRRTH